MDGARIDEAQDLPVGIVPVSDPAEVGLDAAGLDRAIGAVEDALLERGGTVQAASLCVMRSGRLAVYRTWGAAAGTPFLVASITKPVTALATLELVQRGLIFLDARVGDILGDFGQAGKEAIRLRHVLSHTSGLPDMVPDNVELRRSHASLDAFYDSLLGVKPLFPPGTAAHYQSTGFLAQARVVEALTGVRLARFLQKWLFEPLGLRRTSLGLPSDVADTGVDGTYGVPVQLPDDQVGEDWNWNSRYWRELGVPWGGLLSTSLDLAALISCVGRDASGENGDHGRSFAPLASSVRRVMLTNQTQGLSYFVPEDHGSDSTVTDFSATGAEPAWGLGWALNRGRRPHRNLFGDFVSPAAFGHTGSTGTAFWYDPAWELAFCLLTTQPSAVRSGLVSRVANIVSTTVTAAPGA